jgi:glyoxylate reductase
VEIEVLLRESDFVCVLVPYTPETVDLIGQDELAIMKKTAVLINTSRGGIVNESALYNALAQETIWAAGLDVLEREPVTIDNPLLTLPNVVILPHIGSASVKKRTGMAKIAACNLCQAMAGEIPQYLINQEIAVKG